MNRQRLKNYLLNRIARKLKTNRLSHWQFLKSLAMR